MDIHRKPGYDPVELFLDPAIRFPLLHVAQFLLKKKLGLRALLKVIPLDATLVRGSHGRVPEDVLDYPILLMDGGTLPVKMEARDVFATLLAAITESGE